MNRMKTGAFTILLIILLNMAEGCQKTCIECKTQFKTYLMYKGADTIVVDAMGTDEDITGTVLDSQREHYNLIGTISDSIYYEKYCGTEELNNLKSMNNEKKYCYPQ